MNWLKHPIAEYQFPQITQLAGTKTKRISQYLTILQLVYQNRRISTQFAADVHNEFKRDHISRSTMHRRIRELIDAGIIMISDPGIMLQHIPPFYSFPQDQLSLILGSPKGYCTKAEYSRRTKSLDIRGYHHWNYYSRCTSVNTSMPESTSFDILPGTEEDIEFLKGLELLRAIPFRFLKTLSMVANSNPNKSSSIKSMPDREFNIDYYLLRTGRIQSIPHVYRGKSVTQFIRPAWDPYLEKGMLFCLDYSTQEIRLLAKATQDQQLLAVVHNEANLNQYFSQNILGGIPDSLSKIYRSAWSYGCSGASLKTATGKYLKSIRSWKHPYFYSIKLIERLNREFPTVSVFREQLAQRWISDGILINSSGITRSLDEHVRLKNGSVSEEKVLRKCLSHIVQGDGAWIMRKIIAASQHSQYVKLVLPVHDGFIFYCKNDNRAEAIKEAALLLNNAASEVTKIPMPFKMEWAIDRSGYLPVHNQFDEFSDGNVTAPPKFTNTSPCLI